jgi:hypothetical protein
MDSVYKKIVDTFKDNEQIFVDKQLPLIRQIDINLGQPDSPEEWEVFLPAMFISWDIKAGAVGESDMLTLDFHLVQEPGTGTESFSGRMDEGLEYIRMIRVVKYLLNALATDHTSPLRYAGERQAITPFFRYHIISYQCSIDSYTDSVFRPDLTEGTILDIDITTGRLRNHSDKPGAIDLEIFS